MKTTIVINCDDAEELQSHLTEIAEKVAEESERQGGDITKRAKLEDNNCYGTHIVIINPNL